jgi:flagellar hook-associated protein 2
VLVSSSDNTFESAIGGVDITVAEASDTPVTVTVSQTDEALVEAVDDFVKSYNALRTDLDKLTAFDPEELTTGLLFGTNEALQIDTRLSRALTDRYFGLGSFESLEQLGLSVDEEGKLELNKTKLKEAYADDPAGVEQFLTNAESGVAVKISAVVDRLAGSDESLLASRSDSIQDTIEANENRMETMNLQLEKQAERLLNQFYQLETLIAKLQQSQQALAALTPVAPIGST